MAVTTLVTSCAMCLIAVWANLIASDVAKETQKTNEYNRQTGVVFGDMPWFGLDNSTHSLNAAVYSCFDSQRNLYVLYYQISKTIGFVNEGGRLVSLVNATFSDGKHTYSIKKQLVSAEEKDFLGPIDLIPGQYQEINFKGTYISSNNNEYSSREEGQAAFFSKPIQGAYWEFVFSDGKVYRSNPVQLGFQSGPEAFNSDFSRDCVGVIPGY